RGKRAAEWRLVDQSIPKSRFDQAVLDEAARLAAQTPDKEGPVGVQLPALEVERHDKGGVTKSVYKYVTLSVDGNARVAELTLRGPEGPAYGGHVSLLKHGAEAWHLRAFRELDDALLDLRFNHPTAGLIVLKTAGDLETVRAWDAALLACTPNWFAREIL